MKKLLIATTNKGKLHEFTKFLSDLPLQTVSLEDVGITDDIKETGSSYKENSQLKAQYYAKKSGLPAIADDGGIKIDALGGAPGIKSKRWLGENTTEKDIVNYMTKLARELPDINRKAVFKVCVSLAIPKGKVYSIEDKVEGIITKKPHMKYVKGYPYRSFFYIPEIGKYYHEDELTNDELRMYNHRWKAVEKLKPIIRKVLSIK